MKTKYPLREVTRDCTYAACSAVYEIARECMAGACPSVHASEASKGSYYVVGRQLTQQEIEERGLAEKVAHGEGVIEVPKGLLRDLKD